jgi:hypothetical protein
MKNILLTTLVSLLLTSPTFASAAESSRLDTLKGLFDSVKNFGSTLDHIKNLSQVVSITAAVDEEPNCSTRPPMIYPREYTMVAFPGISEQELSFFYANRDFAGCPPSPIQVTVSEDFPEDEQWRTRLIPEGTVTLPPNSGSYDNHKEYYFQPPTNARPGIRPVVVTAKNLNSGETNSGVLNIKFVKQPFILRINPETGRAGTKIRMSGTYFTSGSTALVVNISDGGYAYIPVPDSDSQTATFTFPDQIYDMNGNQFPAPPGEYAITIQSSDQVWATNYKLFTLF